MVFDKEEYQESIARLSEREKEMKCLYKVQDIINHNYGIDDFLMQICKHIWGGWQYPIITRVKITFEKKTYKEDGWEESEWMHSADIVVDDKVSGLIQVYYTEARPLISDSPFLPEEQKLLNTIAKKVAAYIFNLKLKRTLAAISQKKKPDQQDSKKMNGLLDSYSDVHWKWRNDMVNAIAKRLKPEEWGIVAMYLIGSVKEGTSGPASDIDILIHFEGSPEQRRCLEAWFGGWSYCLSEINLEKTGYKTDGLIDLHIITSADIEAKNSFASMIGRHTDGARLIIKQSV